MLRVIGDNGTVCEFAGSKLEVVFRWTPYTKLFPIYMEFVM